MVNENDTSVSGKTEKTPNEKAIKTVFVIMPFSQTHTRNASQLTAFYENEIKRPIESEDFSFRYLVRRSDDAFLITDQIIKDLYTADVVVCDLSGPEANPNVMYELGIRLAVSTQPVVLIREANKLNRPIFNVSGFYTELYDPLDYAPLRDYLLGKIRRLENGEETWHSPVLRAIDEETPLPRRLSAHKAFHLLATMAHTVEESAWLFGYAMQDHLMLSKQSYDLGDSPMEAWENISKDVKTFNSVSWTDFRYSPGSLPPLEYYISTRYLEGLVDGRVEARFTSLALRYYGKFFSGDWLTRNWNPRGDQGAYASS